MRYEKGVFFWKKNLSDTLKKHINIKKLDHFEIDDFNMMHNVINKLDEINQLIDIEEMRINNRRGLKHRQNDNWIAVKEIYILIAPIKIKPKEESFPYLKDTNEKFPFWYFAKVDRRGKLHIPKETFPVFQQKFLKPVSERHKEFVFAKSGHIDKIRAIAKKEFHDYTDYIYCLQDIFKKAVNYEIISYKAAGYEVTNNGIVLLPHKEILLRLESDKVIEKHKILNEELVLG